MDTPWKARVGKVAPLVGGLLAAGLLNFVGVFPALGVTGVLGIAALVVFGRGSQPAALSQFRWLPYAWVGLLFASDLNFNNRIGRTPLEAAAGRLSPSNVGELAIYGLVALLVAVHWSSARRLGGGKGLGPLVLWPPFAVLSTLWSIIPEFTLVRSLQLAVAVALGTVLVRIWLASDDFGELVWTKALRFFVILSTVFTIHAIVATPAAVLFIRFEWRSQHATVTGYFLAAALVVLIVGGRRLTQFSMAAYAGQLVLLSTAFLLTRTRTSIVGLVVSLVIVMWLGGRRRILLRYLGFAYTVLFAGAIWAVASRPIQLYLERGQDQTNLSSLSGRVPLWTFAIDTVRESGNWMHGFGYGASRVTLFAEFDWAGTAHNAWLEVLLGAGLVGVFLLAAGVFYVGYRLLVRAVFAGDRSSLVAGGLFLVNMIAGITTPNFALPGFGFSLLVLLNSRAAALDPVPVASSQVAQGRGLGFPLSPATR